MATVEVDRDRRRGATGFGLGLVFALGLAVRLVAARQYGEHPLGRLAWVDEGAYRARAIEIAGGAWLPPGPFYQDPLFPYLLALIGKGVGFAVPTLRLALALLGSATPPLIYLAARRGFGRAEAVVAGLVAALYRARSSSRTRPDQREEGGSAPSSPPWRSSRRPACPRADRGRPAPCFKGSSGVPSPSSGRTPC